MKPADLEDTEPETSAEAGDWLFFGVVLALPALSVVTGYALGGGYTLSGVVGVAGVLVGIGILVAGRLHERNLVETV